MWPLPRLSSPPRLRPLPRLHPPRRARPRPRLHPSPPPASPPPLASALFHAFTTRDERALAHAFSDHATPDATLDGRPLRLILHTHPLGQMHYSRETAYTETSRSETAAIYIFTFLRDPLP